jgi:hypothetical protein
VFEIYKICPWTHLLTPESTGIALPSQSLIGMHFAYQYITSIMNKIRGDYRRNMQRNAHNVPTYYHCRAAQISSGIAL